MKTKIGITKLQIAIMIFASLIGIGFAIVIVKPEKKLLNSRNSQRRNDVVNILNAVYQYTEDNQGRNPADLAETPIEICNSRKAVDCQNLINLSALTENKLYLETIPVDPKVKNENGTGYQINKLPNGRITVGAINPEGGVTIASTR